MITNKKDYYELDNIIPKIENEQIPFNEDKTICGECGGKCCKSHPCSWFPQDLPEVTEEVLTKMVIRDFCFNYWDGEECTYFLQPKIKDIHGYPDDSIIQPIWCGECVFLGKTGCKLPFEQRGSQGKALHPKNDKGICFLPDGYSKRDCVDAWKPYQNIIQKVIDKLS